MANLLDLQRESFLTVGGTPNQKYFDWLSAEYKNIKFRLPPVHRHVCSITDAANSPGIAFKYYQNVDNWWVVCQYNGIIEPVSAFYPGRVLLLPGLTDLNAFLAEDRSWYPDNVNLDYVHSDPRAQKLGPLIVYGLLTNAYHNELGRGGYFHWNSGTSEGQSIAIEGALLAYEVLNNGFSEEQDAADWYYKLALSMLDALGNGTGNGPMLRQEIPEDVRTICLMHWLFAARGDIPSQAINYDFLAPNYGGSITIPAEVPEGPYGQKHKGGKDVFRVWQVFPDSSYLLYNSPYSPSYDNYLPIVDTSLVLDSEQIDNGNSPNWLKYQVSVDVGLPVGAPLKVKNWNVIYGYNNAGIIPMGSALEAYPCWTALDSGYSACAPDTYRWFDYALDLAIKWDGRADKVVGWTKLREATRRTCVRGQNITDLREVIRPMPQFEVIPIRGEPSGMFCYSDHPLATVPNEEQIKLGANIAWSGFNFWSRVGGQNGVVAPGEFVWSPATMFQPGNWEGDIFNGSIQGDIPAAEGDSKIYQTQFGRGFNDEWRDGTEYQTADQFIFLAMTCDYKPQEDKDEHFYIYVSSTKFYSGETRWFADIGQYPEFEVGNSADGGPRYFLIPREHFVRKDFDNAVLPIGTRFENFGVYADIQGSQAFSLRVVFLRPVSGDSPEWVFDNYQEAVHGSVMPFFPGAIPFATNADLPRQQFIGFNGIPFHGYQLPDHWYKLETHAEVVHPTLTVANLPIPDPATGAMTYPIQAKTTGGVTKPKHALLMEQQLIFLQQAQNKYVEDGGAEGPWAHTFVLNTPARASIGNPTPHTWVYTNDDPNTRWTGYQSRVVDSLGRLVYETRDDPAFADCNEMSATMAFKWINRLNILWPNIAGKLADGSDSFWVYGPPTDYPDPRISGPTTLYEEPHAPALVLRGCVWLKASGKMSPAQVAVLDAVGTRVFDYLKFLWISDPFSPMRYTWGSISETGTYQYYGFWIFEILSTLAYMIKHPEGAPAGVDLGEARNFIRLHYRWLIIKGNVIERGDDFDPKAQMYKVPVRSELEDD